MNIRRQNWLLNRRHVLHGLGVSLALPLLNCMQPLRALGTDAAARPRRSVFIYLPNGVNPLDYQITEAGADYKLSKPLQSLAKHRDQFTPISGLHHPHGLGHHHNCRNIWLTGGKIGASERNTISVDQLMAQVTEPKTRYASLELSNQGPALAWNADGIQLPALSNPAVVFRSLFEAPKDSSGAVRRSRLGRGPCAEDGPPIGLPPAPPASHGLGKGGCGAGRGRGSAAESAGPCQHAATGPGHAFLAPAPAPLRQRLG